MDRGTRRKGTIWSRLLAAFAFVAIAAHALLPPGYMLSAPQQGQWVSITLCGGDDAEAQLLDVSTGAVIPAHQAPDHGDKGAKSNGPCVFAASPAWAAPPSAAAPATLAAPVRDIAPRFVDATFLSGRGLAAPPPWSTGPPFA
ncbi:hypothetical protein [Terricaulis sp.]|uniref:hypothetical protein n=1 Tax=Terricaulis sp. TaxID=2768686 RepID=UPI0037848EA3